MTIGCKTSGSVENLRRNESIGVRWFADKNGTLGLFVGEGSLVLYPTTT
jgi:hypothetical protein